MRRVCVYVREKDDGDESVLGWYHTRLGEHREGVVSGSEERPVRMHGGDTIPCGTDLTSALLTARCERKNHGHM